MKEYLKMADVFVGKYSPAIRINQFPAHRHGEQQVELYGVPANYAAHAINSHDELVAEVERLRGENDALMKCRMAAREFFNCTVASGGSVKVSSANKAALDDADKASDWLEIELKATADLVKK